MKEYRAKQQNELLRRKNKLKVSMMIKLENIINCECGMCYHKSYKQALRMQNTYQRIRKERETKNKHTVTRDP